MNSQFAFATVVRTKFAHWVEELSTDQMNQIPEGFNNNIAWHLGHIVVSTEILCYHRTGADPNRYIEGADRYRNGTRPEAYIDAAEIARLKDRLWVSLEEISADYDAGKFDRIQPFQTMTFGFEMTDMELVLQCCTHHDVLHMGQAGMLRRLV